MLMASIRIGIVTVSDRASQGVYEDRGGPAIRDCLAEILSCPWEPVPRLIPDERPLIEATLRELVRRRGLLPGRHDRRHRPGPARRDARSDRGGLRQAPRRLRRTDAGGVAAVGADGDPVAADRRHPRPVADRQPARQAGAIRDCLLAVFPAIPYCIDLIDGPYLTTNEAVVKAFRPKK